MSARNKASLPAGGRRAGDRALCSAEGTWPLSEWAQRTCRQAPTAAAGRGVSSLPLPAWPRGCSGLLEQGGPVQEEPAWANVSSGFEKAAEKVLVHARAAPGHSSLCPGQGAEPGERPLPSPHGRRRRRAALGVRELGAGVWPGQLQRDPCGRGRWGRAGNKVEAPWGALAVGAAPHPPRSCPI